MMKYPEPEALAATTFFADAWSRDTQQKQRERMECQDGIRPLGRDDLLPEHI
jgi:hypothetical protein